MTKVLFRSAVAILALTGAAAASATSAPVKQPLTTRPSATAIDRSVLGLEPARLGVTCMWVSLMSGRNMCSEPPMDQRGQRSGKR